MSGFNQNAFNTTQFNQAGFGPAFIPVDPFPYDPGTGPYDYPQITIANPIVPPPMVLTNVSSLLRAHVVGVLIFWNGLLQTEGVDYTRQGQVVTMKLPPAAPDIVTAAVFARGLQQSSVNPRRYLAPWTLRLSGPYDGVGLSYRIVVGPTILGATDSVNNLFTWGVSCKRIQMYRNGLLMAIGSDYSGGSTAAVFLPGAIPQPGDILTIFGW